MGKPTMLSYCKKKRALLRTMDDDKEYDSLAPPTRRDRMKEEVLGPAGAVGERCKTSSRQVDRVESWVRMRAGDTDDV